MAELNKNKNSKQLDRPDALWKNYNKWIAQLTKLFTLFRQNLVILKV